MNYEGTIDLNSSYNDDADSYQSDEDGYYDAETGIFYSNNFKRKVKKLLITDLPFDIIYEISKYLEKKDIISLLTSTSYFYHLYQDDNKKNFKELVNFLTEYNRSQMRSLSIIYEREKIFEDFKFNYNNPIIYNIINNLYLIIYPNLIIFKQCDYENVLNKNYKELTILSVHIYNFIEIKLTDKKIFIDCIINIDNEMKYNIRPYQINGKYSLSVIPEKIDESSTELIISKDTSSHEFLRNPVSSLIFDKNNPLILIRKYIIFIEINKITVCDNNYKILKVFNFNYIEERDSINVSILNDANFDKFVRIQIDKHYLNLEKEPLSSKNYYLYLDKIDTEDYSFTVVDNFRTIIKY